MGDNISYLLVMDQNLGQHEPSKSMVDGNVPIRESNDGEKSNKRNQCKYAPPSISSLGRHFKKYGGEKSKKYNQCDFASFRSDHLRVHLKIHTGEKQNKCNQ